MAMKELSIEEKARLYDEALKEAAIAHKDEDRHLKATLERIFPALKENEDKKLREQVIYAINQLHVCECTKDKLRAWVENAVQQDEKPVEQDTETRDLWEYIREWDDKFGRLPKDEDELASCIYYVMKRQKPADKVEPKFKVGDWIVSNTNPNCVNSIMFIADYNNDSRSYLCRHRDGQMEYSYEFIENSYHLWTIDDAKDGDILATSAGAFIYNGNNGGGSYPGSYCGIATLGRFQTGVKHHWTGEKVYPATKEQSDQLFAKIHKADYEWDAEKKELKKIEQKPSIEGSFVNVDEVREDFMREVYRVLNADPTNDRANQIISAFDNLPTVTIERQGEQKPNCSEEAMKYLKENHSPSEVSDFQAAMNIAVAKAYDKGKADAITEMQNYAWSEEDEKKLKTIIDVMYGGTHLAYEKELNWLKTLKNRILKQKWIKEDNENNPDLASNKKVYEKMIRIANFYRSIEGETDLRLFGIDFNNLDDSENYKKDGKLINQDFAFSHPETRDAFYKNFKQDLLKIKNYIK